MTLYSTGTRELGKDHHSVESGTCLKVYDYGRENNPRLDYDMNIKLVF